MAVAAAALPAAAASDEDDGDGEALDAAELMKRPAKARLDPKQTGAVKVIDLRRQQQRGGSGKKDKKAAPEKQRKATAPAALTGAAALKALLPVVADVGAGMGLAAWD